MADNFEMKWNAAGLDAIIQKVAMDGLRDGAEHILKEAINEAPLDTGTLRRSGTVTVGGLPQNPDAVYKAAEAGQTTEFNQSVGNELAVYISFNTPYAVRQHEELGYAHPNGGKAKYLEDPLKANVDKVQKYVADMIRKTIGG